jgi:hypothetical protein
MAGLTVYRQTITFRDARGFTSWMKFFVQGNTDVQARTRATTIVNLITPATNAALQTTGGIYVQPPKPIVYGAVAKFENCEDKCRLVFATIHGAPFTIDLPAPKSRLFRADQETYNRQDAVANGLANAFMANGVATRDGEFVTTFIGGYRLRVPLRRRLSLPNKSPDLTGSGE